MDTTPLWVNYVRKFVATGRAEFLEMATNSCSDSRIRELLGERETGQGALALSVWEPVARQLKSEGRVTESAAIVLIGFRGFALVIDHPEEFASYGQPAIDKAEWSCELLLSASREHDFTECEAYLLTTLGAYSANRCQWQKACELLEQARDLYAGLAEAEPELYRAQAATTLNNLGTVLTERRDFDRAQNVLHEAVRIREALAAADPELYRPFVATTWHNLGIALHEAGEYDRAGSALSKALVIRRILADTDPASFEHEVASTLNSFGNVLQGQRGLAAARQHFAEALGICRTLSRQQSRSHQAALARTLANFGNLLREQRDYSAALALLEEAAATFGGLATSEPELHKCSEAACLNNLGLVLHSRREFGRSQDAFMSAIRIYGRLLKRDPGIYPRHVASTLLNLGAVLSDDGEHAKARVMYHQAVGISRALATEQPHTNGLLLAHTLNGFGNALVDAQDYSGARGAYEESCTLLRSLAAEQPSAYLADVVVAENNLVKVMARLCEHEQALGHARRAVQTAENSEADERDMWLVKGRASASYRELLAHLIRGKDADAVFRYLAALREGSVRVTREVADESLETALETLREVSGGAGQRVCVVIGQYLRDSGAVLAVLDGENSRGLQWYRADRFHDAGVRLFLEIGKAFDRDGQPGREGSWQGFETLAEDAWNKLPNGVREVLDPASDSDVLISGDALWTAFPWEALRCGSGEADWLGLQRHLARWGGVTGGALGCLRRRSVGEGRKTAAIVCPWNAGCSSESHLVSAKQEAGYVTEVLAQEGYTIVPEGGPLIGRDANAVSIGEVISHSSSVIHYSGHGAIVGNEEVLVLHSGDDLGPVYFGRRELEDLNVRLARDKLLSHGPIVILNCCRAGRVRDWGGKREDLAWALLNQGAEAVIASALPVYDAMGKILGESLYSPLVASTGGMGATLVRVRRLLASVSRSSMMWPTWALVTYHGNPYVELPHAIRLSSRCDDTRWLGLLKRIARWLGLRDATEARDLMQELRK